MQKRAQAQLIASVGINVARVTLVERALRLDTEHNKKSERPSALEGRVRRRSPPPSPLRHVVLVDCCA